MKPLQPIRYLIILAALFLAGCGVMHFQNGETASPLPERSLWRHNVVYSMLELGRPVDMAKLCPGGWSEVTTQLTFVDAVLGYLDNVATFPLISGGLDLWQPQTVKYRCR